MQHNTLRVIPRSRLLRRHWPDAVTGRCGRDRLRFQQAASESRDRRYRERPAHGMERAALQGSKQTVVRFRPLRAMSIYHHAKDVLVFKLLNEGFWLRSSVPLTAL